MLFRSTCVCRSDNNTSQCPLACELRLSRPSAMCSREFYLGALEWGRGVDQQGRICARERLMGMMDVQREGEGEYRVQS